jgi:single-stranded-DNA-specific exonuclease
MVQRRWIVPDVDGTLAGVIREKSACSSLLARLLLRRGVLSPDEAAVFLDPKLLQLSDPFDLPDMDRAVERIAVALRRSEPITIFGDYDVDGIASTCLLLDFFRLIEVPVSYRVPHRLADGYGLRIETIEEFAATGTRLLITVDNGSSSRAAIARAGELGIDVVVTDHHEPSSELPEPVAFVNPLLDRTGRVFRHFSGAGVAFKLVWALCKRLSKGKKLTGEYRDFVWESMSLAALGTIADVVPLRGENRVIATHGLRTLMRSTKPGIRALVEVALAAESAGAQGAAPRLRARHVGFRVGPRLNAVGRLGHAAQAIELLTTSSDERARVLLAELEAENDRRRSIEAAILKTARERVLAEVDLEREKAIVLVDPGWHPGVIGIVSARITEEFHRPTLLLCVDGDRARGSARSIPQVHITDALARCRHLLRSFGGHARAAGADLDLARVTELRAALNDAIPTPISEMVPEIEADGEIRLEDLSPGLLEDLAKLEPHGEGNPEPLLVARGVEVVGEPKLIGREGRHVSFWVRHAGRSYRAVAFGQAAGYETLRSSPSVSLLFQPRWNEWGGRREIELDVREIRGCEDGEGAEEPRPGRRGAGPCS